MHEATISYTTDRIADLKRKLAARRNQRGYEANVPAIQAEIVRLEAALKGHQS